MTITKKQFSFKMGADPEFNMLFEKNRLNAKNTLTVLLDKDKKIKRNENRMGYEVKKAGIIGWDGECGTGEMRPAPSNTPEGLTENIKNLIKEVSKKTKLFKLSTSSFNAPIGGHIHIELSQKTLRNIASIHRKLASFYLPIMLGENCINMRIRNRSNYGLISDYRTRTVSDDGKIKTYEFRTPSAEWLTTEKICRSTLAYIATVYNEITKHPTNFNKTKEIVYKNQKQGEALQNIALTRYASLAETVNNKIKKAIRTFEFYPKYKKEIDFIMNANKVIEEKEKVEFNMLLGWNLIKQKEPSKKELFSDKKTKEIIAEIDGDKLNKLITKIKHNANDQNTEIFENAIKERILAYNWDIKHEYYIFGLKKGINKIITFNRGFELLNPKEIIKTKTDLSLIYSMYNKVINKIPALRATDAKETEEMLAKKQIFIGIPYKTRIKLETKEFIELIYKIEVQNTKFEQVNQDELETSSEKEATDLEKTLTTEDLELTNEDREDTEDRNKSIAREIINEERRDIRDQNNESDDETTNIDMEVGDPGYIFVRS